MIEQLDMFGNPVAQVKTAVKQGPKPELSPSLFGDIEPVKKEVAVQTTPLSKPEDKPAKTKVKKAEKVEIIDLTGGKKPVAEEKVADESKPLPSECYAGQVITLFKAYLSGLSIAFPEKKGDAYYQALYMQWTAPTAEEERLPFNKKTSEYYEKCARVYVWPILWRIYQSEFEG